MRLPQFEPPGRRTTLHGSGRREVPAVERKGAGVRRELHGSVWNVFLMALLLIVTACQDGSHRGEAGQTDGPGRSKGLSDGVYAVLQEAASPESARVDAPGSIVLVYDRKYSDSDKGTPPEYLAIDTGSFVPMILEGSPVARKDDRGFTLLSVTLARDQVKPLEEFTRTHLGGRVAIILDGEVVSMHKVRSVIEGGKLQITRCGDNACDVLFSKLTN